MSRRKQRFLKTLAQAGFDVEKVLPRRNAKGSGLWLAKQQFNRNGKILGEGHVCSLPVETRKEVLFRKWASGK